jgi:hypothetical protein
LAAAPTTKKNEKRPNTVTYHPTHRIMDPYRIIASLHAIENVGYANFLDFMSNTLWSQSRAVERCFSMFIQDTSAINHATKLLYDKNAAKVCNAPIDLITARVNKEPKALDKSPFFRQSPIAQDVQALSYQPFDDQHENLAPFTRRIFQRLCGVNNPQTVDNPGRASGERQQTVTTRRTKNLKMNRRKAMCPVVLKLGSIWILLVGSARSPDAEMRCNSIPAIQHQVSGSSLSADALLTLSQDCRRFGGYYRTGVEQSVE